MKNQKSKFLFIATFAVFILFIIDAKTAAKGVADGIDVCLKVVVPSLFPFFVITTYLNDMILGHPLRFLLFISKKLHIPSGCEYILPLGLTGGYPVGAKLIADMYNAKKIDKRTAHILLGYCNNAGPAFIFGIAGAAFASPAMPFILWLTLIISAVLTGFLLPKPKEAVRVDSLSSSPSLSKSVKSGISACVSVCGWIITFKIILAYLQQWFANFLLTKSGIIFTGILELSNGCMAATQLENPAVRFTVYSVFLSFGGLCIYLQTASVTERIGLGLYTHGKIIQTCISLVISVVTSIVLFRKEMFSMITASILVTLSAFILMITIRKAKKVVENS